MRLVFMSACLQDYHCSKVKIYANETHQGKSCFSKLKCHRFLYKTANLYILSGSYTSKSMLDTKNVRYGGIFKASKKTR